MSAAREDATFLDAVVRRVRAAASAADGTMRPAAVLWLDPERHWQPLVPDLRAALPELVVLGEFAPEERTGPAIWIRCAIERVLDAPRLPVDRTPVVLLPGVGRQELRAGEDCAAALRPLVELLFRGTSWLQRGGHEWTLTAFLTSAQGLGLDLARDEATRAALSRAVREVARTPLAQLRVKRLEAEDFDRLLTADLLRDVLCWMGDPAQARARWDPSAWGAFVSRCRSELALDPERDADVVAGDLLGTRAGAWSAVWQRFTESPASYPGVPELLRRSRRGLPFDREPWPDLNDEAEAELRRALAGVAQREQREACDAVAALEAEHGPRRSWVWAKLGMSPLAKLIEPLARLASIVRAPMGGSTPEEHALSYVDGGWRADRAALEALARTSPADEGLVAGLIRTLMGPWLDESARSFQAALERVGNPARSGGAPVDPGADGCVVFADGLRYDLGRSLADRLALSGYRVTLRRRWAAAPTVTATAKPAVTPVANEVRGSSLAADFHAELGSDGRPADAQNLRATMVKRGYQILDAAACNSPNTSPARGWLEAGKIDQMGHQLGARLARQIEDELERLADVVARLLESGWARVQVVTDHGWLLLPGGLPRVDLPLYLTASRWSRCAVVSENVSSEVLRHMWYWNPAHSFAAAPGSACFNTTEEYAHGGLSIQECLTPEIIVEPAMERTRVCRIESITWRGLRCFVVAGPGANVRADIRLARPTGASVAAAVKAVSPDGTVSLVLADDEHEQDDLVVVLSDESGAILDHRPTRVGATT